MPPLFGKKYQPGVCKKNLLIIRRCTYIGEGQNPSFLGFSDLVQQATRSKAEAGAVCARWKMMSFRLGPTKLSSQVQLSAAPSSAFVPGRNGA